MYSEKIMRIARSDKSSTLHVVRNGWECLGCGFAIYQRRPPRECDICYRRKVKRPGWRHLKAPVPPPTKKGKRGSVTPSRREFVYARDGYRCVGCGEEDRSLLTLDHIKPKCKGGDNQVENLQTLCRDCNCRKGSVYPFSFELQAA